MSKFSKHDVQRSFNQASRDYDSAAFVQRETADRLFERLQYVTMQPKTILDLGCGTGYLTQKLAEEYPQAQLTGADVAPGMLNVAQTRCANADWCCADAVALPFASQSFDLITSNLMLQWIDDIGRVFVEVRRLLRPGGLFMFTTKGPDTLKELRYAWAEVDNQVHVSDFIDMHDLGDALVHAQFADPVMDSTILTIQYQRVLNLLHDLKTIGAHNLDQQRARGLMGRKKFQRFMDAYESLRQDNKVPATYEIIFGQAWAGEGPVGYRADEEGNVTIPLSQLRRRD